MKRRCRRGLRLGPGAAVARGVLAIAVCLLVGLANGAWVDKASGNEPERDRQRPNFVFFLVDDLGWADLGCYGNEFHETPNIDRLAAEGMRFTDAYAACPVCSPTRASILTGKYPATLDLTDFIPGHWRPWEKLIVPEFNQQLPSEEVTFAEALKPEGYVSASFGKWHLGGPDHFPDVQGFDEYVVTAGRHFGSRFRGSPPVEADEGDYLANVLTRRAERFMESHRERPFVLYLSHYAVHIPLEAEQSLIEKYEQKEKPETGVNHPVYAAMVEHVDISLGRIVAKLDELGLAEDTVIVFFSDNGGLYRRFDDVGPVVTSNAPLRDEKGSLYEGGIRVPLIVRWPGEVEPGSTSDEPVSSVDLLPTMLDMAGADDRTPESVDGASLVPILKGQDGLEREAIYWHYPHYHHTSPAGAVRMGDWKLIEYFDDGHVELYNLADDIGEANNLAKQEPNRAKQLQSALADWRERVGAKMPVANPDYDAERAHLWGDRRRKPSKTR